MTRSRIPFLAAHHQTPFSPSTLLQTIPDKQLPASPPATPLFNSSESCTTSIPSPSSSCASLPTSTSSTKSLRPKLTNTMSIASENIQVMVRCRPPTVMETQNLEQDCWILMPEQGTVKLDESSSTIFEYDRVFKGADNSEIYESGIQKLVRSTMDGYNGTVFAYGQTASGKTYTMTGTSEEPGVIPKAVEDVFAYIEEVAIDREFLLQVSYMEIYNEKINDLLNTGQSSTGLSIRTTTLGQDYVENLSAMTVTTPEEVLNYIKSGEERRHTSETDFNKNSSRSHTIFQLIIESKSRSSSLASVRTSRLNLIDLAGSEKVAANSERRQEGSYINKSLLTLGKVITQLNEGARHIPYRDSKLTRILSPSLSGNDRVAVICTINPAWKSKDESTNTLRFAQGVKKVRINPKMTQVAQNSRLQNYKEQIAELEIQMQRKTEQEAETKERLSHLLSLILTSSKATQNVTTSKLAEAVSNPELLLNGSIGDVVKECEQHLSASIYKHQDEINRRDQDIHQIEDRYAQCRKSLEEKSMVIEELQMTLQDYHGINEDLQSQLDKYRNSFVEVNKRWNGLESSINDYKERLVISEGKVAMLEAQQKADDQIKKQLEQHLEDFKAEMEQRLQDDGLIGMVQSLRDDLDEDEDNDLDAHSGNKTEHLEELDHLVDYDMNHGTQDSADQQSLIDLKTQIHQMEVDAEQQRQAYMAELEEEREQNNICRRKIYQVQAQLDQVEAALKQAKIDEVEHALNLAKLNRTETNTPKSSSNTITPQLSTVTLISIASSDEPEPSSSGMKMVQLIGSFLYLNYSACVLLLAFAFWLFV